MSILRSLPQNPASRLKPEAVLRVANSMADRLHFGPFELRTDSGELLRAGARVRLQPQAARLLELLARRSGEVVFREEIRRHLWGDGTFVDFEQGLNFLVRRIRLALDDSATNTPFRVPIMRTTRSGIIDLLKPMEG